MLLQHFGIVCRVTMVDPSTPLSSVLYSTPATNHHQKISPERKSQRACIFTSITMHKYDEKILLVKYRKNTEKNLPKHQTNFLHEKKKPNPTTQIRIFWSRMKTKSFCILFSIRENAFKIPH